MAGLPLLYSGYTFPSVSAVNFPDEEPIDVIRARC